MKLILIILSFGLIIAAAGLATPEDYCVWQAKRGFLFFFYLEIIKYK